MATEKFHLQWKNIHYSLITNHQRKKNLFLATKQQAYRITINFNIFPKH